ncbi:hypothetical protein BS47DRAFT_1399683 [Hydnum rufescens UP504]|uniref:Uncharacterized protein n=1 Tax=Hydnum rufescens UP504 TaxID=1448309 RepID=A0A9P6AIA9_9AGAM|nr:hypothetical protein BS47DRAFT_1399683 [Hydnum rufescens UP504]
MSANVCQHLGNSSNTDYFHVLRSFLSSLLSLICLSFAAGLFINLAPNEMAWRQRSQNSSVLKATSSLFPNALAQYQVLMQVVEAEVSKSVEVARNLALAASVTLSAQHFKAELPTLDESTPLFDRSYLNGQSEDGHSHN